MTAKDKLRQAVEELRELEAEQTLAFITRRRDHDPVVEAFGNAPDDDEPFTEDDERALQQAAPNTSGARRSRSTTSAASVADTPHPGN